MKTHVNRVLAKLGVTTRVQAVVLAYESRAGPARRWRIRRRCAPRSPDRELSPLVDWMLTNKVRPSGLNVDPANSSLS